MNSNISQRTDYWDVTHVGNYYSSTLCSLLSFFFFMLDLWHQVLVYTTSNYKLHFKPTTFTNQLTNSWILIISHILQPFSVHIYLFSFCIPTVWIYIQLWIFFYISFIYLLFHAIIELVTSIVYVHIIQLTPLLIFIYSIYHSACSNLLFKLHDTSF